MQAMAAEGPTRHAIEPARIVFEGLARLAPKADANYRIKAKGIRPGDLRTRFQLSPTKCKARLPRKKARGFTRMNKGFWGKGRGKRKQVNG